eukprot:CAMPEP_0170568072 /NCGR_PEP_ID=MMETSP0211-20121228/80908_1 /TAXON_ID=311385 /ORGANISM="Pseudokeronopsis sp., Strain OXSARD2" /LENGTH=74 /DNA_ID=CAMNT_0010889747 /DNA_START=1103 /DNA_END=1327 /DNA_ORIENTATION=-
MMRASINNPNELTQKVVMKNNSNITHLTARSPMKGKVKVGGSSISNNNEWDSELFKPQLTKHEGKWDGEEVHYE